MKILNMTEGSKIYTSNVYLVLGTWNAIDDVNTLIDVGRDPTAMKRITDTHTGVGKKKVDQVILTHSHYDHASLLPQIKKAFNPKVYAFSPNPGVDELLKHGDKLKIADEELEVLHTPGHTNDSICLFCGKSGALFAGDTPLIITSSDYSYEERFVEALIMITSREVRSIYFGHGMPVLKGARTILHRSMKHALWSVLNRQKVSAEPSGQRNRSASG